MSDELAKPTTNAASQISTGAGIAIAAIWVMMTLMTLALITLFFVWPDPVKDEDLSDGTVFTVLFFIILPLIVAYSMTKRIIRKDGS